MGTLTYSTYTGTVKSDEEMVAEVQAAISRCLSAGESYTVFGSHARAYSLAELQRLEARYRARVLARRGATGRNYADLSDPSGEHDMGEVPE
jgi:hypothetical protein